jgi:4-aminobutyrate aminotransferase-like enzyme
MVTFPSLFFDFEYFEWSRCHFSDMSMPIGVESGGCGTVSMRVRPMLVFRPPHAQQLVDAISKSVAQL